MTIDQSRPERILIVEDEALIAFEVEQTLIAAGFQIAGIAGKLEAALALVESGTCDAAVLDTNLNRVSAAPVATALTERGVPFIVTSGYSREQLPEAFKAAPLIEKPSWPGPLVAALNSVLRT